MDKYTLWSLWFLCLCFGHIVGVTDEDYKKLPKVFEMDNYRTCKSENNLYCKFKFKLNPKSEDNYMWKVIEETKKNRAYFHYDLIYRSKCLPKEMNGKTDEILKIVSSKENLHLQNDSLAVELSSMECLKYEVDLTTFDYFVGLLASVFTAAVIYSTIIDYKYRKNNKEEVTGSKKHISTWVQMLSIIAGWEKLKKPINNPDYQKLKAMQGIRTYNMCLVILGHTILSFTIGYVNNPSVIENFHHTYSRRFFKNIFLHIVQTNYLLSAWLYINYLYTYVETKKFTFKDSLKIIMYRYLRLFPLLAYMIIIHRSRLFKLLLNGPHFEFADIDNFNCQERWWTTLSLTSTAFLMPGEMCNFGSWYIANEFQAFVICTFLLYLKLKFKLDDLKFFGTLLAIPILIHAYHIYVNDFEVIFPTTPERCKLENFLNDYSVYVLYTAPYCNFGSYVVGLIFGSIYYKHKNTNVKITKWMTIGWLVSFSGLLFIPLLLSVFDYPTFLGAVIGSCLKPIFSVGIGIGILGMAFNIGGIVKKICELEVAEFFAKWTYTTYLTHFAIAFSRSMAASELRSASEWDVFRNGVSDITLSWITGLVLHLFVERPLTNITNKILGFESKQDEKVKKNENNNKNE